MPTYSNASSVVVNLGGLRLEPGQTGVCDGFYINLPSGVTQTAVTPYVAPVVSSAKITTTTTITVPSTYTDSLGKVLPLIDNYQIDVYVSTGDCTVKLHDANSIAEYVGLGQKWSYPCFSPTVRSIIVTIVSGTVYVTVKKI